ncbi:MAG: patatin-like phospholipase family protein [Gemmatimonadaceae bacterium]
MPKRNVSSGWRWCAALLAASGCAVVHRPPATIASIVAYGDSARVAERATVDTVVARLAQRAAARGDRTLDVLLLSGGGQHGAYGVGFLRGWRERPGAPMPAFDLVTGVSTGALQAPFALLGTEAALDTLSAVYGRAADEIAPTINWLFWLRRTGGLVKTDRYERTIERLFDTRLRDQLEVQFRSGRQLVVSTTDFDLGVGRDWDIRRELGSTADGIVRARTLFVASTAIPGIFPPVVLDGHVQADGGVVSNLAAVLDLDDYRVLAERLGASGTASAASPVTVRVWVVMNMFTHAPVQVTDPASRRRISARGNGLLFGAQQSQVVRRLAELARAVSTDVPGLRMELRYTAVPAELSREPGANKLFDADWMRRLDTLGYERARSASPWDALPSAYERPPSIRRP